MGTNRNIGNDGGGASVVFGLIFFILIFVLIGYAISHSPNQCLMLKEKTYPETVKSITYGNGFLEGAYCTIATDKDVYTESHTSTCVKNKVGNKLILADWENGACQE